MSGCRSLTNLIGNGVATLVVSVWEKEISGQTLSANLARGGMPEAIAPVPAASAPVAAEAAAFTTEST